MPSALPAAAPGPAHALQAMSPVTHPVRNGSSSGPRGSSADGASTSASAVGGPADPLLLGEWELVYASNGTVRRRSP